MDRRSVLATAGSILTFTVTGCLGDGDEPGNGSEATDTQENDSGTDDTEGNSSEYSIEDRTYEECHLISIEYEWLPEDVKNEVDTALEEGRYDSDGLLFAETVDLNRSYLVVDGTPYNPAVKVDDGNGRSNSMRTRSSRHRSRGSSPFRTPTTATTRYTSNERATIRFSTRPWRSTQAGSGRSKRPTSSAGTS